MKKPIVPHITEKSYRMISEKSDQASSYTFKVPAVLRKEQIKKLVEKEHKVTVTGIRIINIPAKNRVFKRIAGTVSGYKKAIVQVKKGDKIASFEQAVEPKEEKKD